MGTAATSTNSKIPEIIVATEYPKRRLSNDYTDRSIQQAAPEITARFRDPGGNVIGLYQQPA
ncbi:MAG: hypothetical protein M3N48_11455 [Verrucomicrobiota bacterium]|nr:hypothetical protein [Verrucomicrobiota bacterium]